MAELTGQSVLSITQTAIPRKNTPDIIAGILKRDGRLLHSTSRVSMMAMIMSTAIEPM